MRFLLNIALIMMFLGCQDVQRPEKPANLISKEKIVDIYTDAYLMNAARSINLKVINESGIHLDSTLYKKYNIDSLQFVKSNAYYSADLNEYLSLFEEVQRKLTLLEEKKDSTRLKNIKKAEIEIENDLIENESGLIDPVETDSI